MIDRTTKNVHHCKNLHMFVEIFADMSKNWALIFDDILARIKIRYSGKPNITLDICEVKNMQGNVSISEGSRKKNIKKSVSGQTTMFGTMFTKERQQKS